jgi:hypothetical protein
MERTCHHDVMTPTVDKENAEETMETQFVLFLPDLPNGGLLFKNCNTIGEFIRAVFEHMSGRRRWEARRREGRSPETRRRNPAADAGSKLCTCSSSVYQYQVHGGQPLQSDFGSMWDDLIFTPIKTVKVENPWERRFMNQHGGVNKLICSLSDLYFIKFGIPRHIGPWL